MRDLDPRTKMIMIICISAVAMITDKLLWVCVLLISVLILMLLMGVTVKQQAKQLSAVVGMAVFLFLLQALFGNVYMGAVLTVRLLIIVMSAMILMTGHIRDYLLALIQCKVPYELAYMAMLAFHFFPILKEEAQDVYYSMQLRGTELQKIGLRKKLGTFRKMCVPILVGALERARDTSTAMELRGFRAYSRRTYMRKLKLKKRDILLMILVPILTVAFAACTKTEPDNVLSGHQAIVSIADENTVTVSWTASKQYRGVVRCDGRDIKAKSIEVTPGEYYRYTAEIDELEPDKTYKYKVGDGKNMSEDGAFSLKAATSDQFSFLYIGDVQYQLRDRDYEIWGDNIKKAYDDNDDVSFSLFAGDMVDKAPDTDDWSAFFTNAEPVFSQLPMMSTVGNHETSVTPGTYIKMMAMPEDGVIPKEVYSFDYGNCHFVSLNSCLFMDERKSQEDYEDTVAEVNNWLKEDLESSKAKWKIVYMHHPMYPVVEDEDIYKELRDNWETVLRDAGVDLVLCGHQHAYMRTEEINGIIYIMANSGEKRSYYVNENTAIPDYVECFYEDGANYLRIDVTKDNITVDAYSMDGKKIDSKKI